MQKIIKQNQKKNKEEEENISLEKKIKQTQRTS
jgi:hypothetical protein